MKGFLTALIASVSLSHPQEHCISLSEKLAGHPNRPNLQDSSQFKLKSDRPKAEQVLLDLPEDSDTLVWQLTYLYKSEQIKDILLDKPLKNGN
jgi:hypothetical protein